MAGLDDIIDRYATRIDKPHIEGAVKPNIYIEKYSFNDGNSDHVVIYDPIERIAHYFIVGGEVRDPVSVSVTHAERDDYVLLERWIKQC